MLGEGYVTPHPLIVFTGFLYFTSKFSFQLAPEGIGQRFPVPTSNRESEKVEII
jgi:hypothetical protein